MASTATSPSSVRVKFASIMRVRCAGSTCSGMGARNETLYLQVIMPRASAGKTTLSTTRKSRKRCGSSSCHARAAAV
eukprot:CAMPEP_0115829596 /NCGR_PEP_ID=MMETSP0287-20121206/1181_1 /TAXON_ID=412157 /ORGANISM="Chrysochromulina rotalis, Strain UIO044" /LENGTH=76 /DNA_ID=CAMNT_0003282869 /DNA_START=584 /DNA_END=814 /DNA_ORIENTATION=+